MKKIIIRIYTLFSGVLLIIVGILAFIAFKTMDNFDEEDGWIKVEATLGRVQEYDIRKKDSNGKLRHTKEYTGDYHAIINHTEVTFQHTVSSRKNLKDTQMFYVQLSSYHDGYESVRPEPSQNIQMASYLFLFLPLMGIVLIYQGGKFTKSST